MKIKTRVIKRYGGKLFGSQDDAAVAFGCEALPLTAADHRERGAVILPVMVRVEDERHRVRMYTYGRVFCGGHNNVVLGVILRFLIDLVIPRTIAFAHTHPLCTGHKPEVFSRGDELVARLPGVTYMYLASPAGRIYRYDGKEPVRNAKGELLLTPIESGLPKILHKWDCRNQKLPRKISVNRLIQKH